MKSSSIACAVAAACGVFAAAPATAQTAPRNTVRVGAYFIHYDVTADDLAGPFAPAGLNLDVKNTNTAYFAYLRRLSPHVEIELAGGWPPKTETVARGPATVGSVPFDGQVIATARWFSPSLLAIYKFGGTQSRWRPYVGAGVNYTHFYDRTSTAAGNAVAGGPTRVSLSDSWGPAGTVGITWQFDRNWSADVSYSRARVKSDLEAETSGIVRKTTIDFKPSAWVVALGYSF